MFCDSAKKGLLETCKEAQKEFYDEFFSGAEHEFADGESVLNYHHKYVHRLQALIKKWFGDGAEK